ncbi:MAG TPA: hypothetical protein DD670_00510, partial [Planctomycetaceae bacterium]|nr:hypothetical protein [Planctomycetaceae bacterium]
WMKRDDLTSVEFPASKGNSGTTSEAWSFGLRNEGHASGPGLSVRANYNGLGDTTRLNTATEGLTEAGKVLDGEWYHIALVIDQTTGLFQAYINGVGSGPDGDNSLWDSNETSYSVTFPTDGTVDFDTAVSLYLGAAGTATGRSSPYKGDIDDFAIWTRALSAAEILAIYQGADILAPQDDIPGDADGNGIVNDADAKRLAENWGATVLNDTYATWWEMGDFNGDNVVNAADASILAANWGWGTSGEATASVPEPGVLALLIGLVCLMTTPRGRKR